jgi:TDG/mug DNA glycosylase family protein
VFCGTALGAVSAWKRAYYAGPGNAFYETLWEVGLTPRRLEPAEYEELLECGIGVTDICKTRSGSDQEVGRSGFDVERLVALLDENRPAWIAFNGKNSASGAFGHPVDYGPQEEHSPACGRSCCRRPPGRRAATGTSRTGGNSRRWSERRDRRFA